MKKLIIGGIAILLALSLLVIACDGIGGEEEFTNVIYSTDANGNLKGVTLLLEGAVPVDRSARALSADIAKSRHDFYEVVFTDGTDVIRASWVIGEPAAISEVKRGGTTNYASPAAATHAAVLFVGTMSDHTLLAVGRIVDADGDQTGVTSPAIAIADDTTRVTFEIASLIGDSSDCVLLPTAVSPAAKPDFEDIEYTAKPLDPDDTFTGTYTISLAGSTFATYGAAIQVDEYSTNSAVSGIFSRDVMVMNKNGGYTTYLSNASSIKVALTNNTGATAAPFAPAIAFTLDTTTVSVPGFTALSFSIPVYAISNDPGAETTKPSKAIIWNIRPGIGAQNYCLDSTQATTSIANSRGGAVLINVGTVTAADVIKINTK